MEKNFDSKIKNKKQLLKSEKNEVADDFFDTEEKLEEGISSEYLNSLDFQMNLEEQIIEDFSQNKNDSLRESLFDLRKSGEESLKMISTKIIKIFNSNKLVVKLRDIYIEKRSIKIYKELSVRNELAKEEDYESFLKLIKSDFWGSSSNSSDASFRANNALNSIAMRFPGKSKEILDVWAEFFSHDIKCSLNLFNGRIVSIKEKEYNSLENNEEKMEYVKSCDDLTALMCLSDIQYDSKDINVSEETLKRLDSLILKHPNVKSLPESITSQLFKACFKNPEEIMSDGRRLDFIFNLWINKIDNFPRKSASSSLVPVLADRLSNCSQEETDKLLKLLLYKWESFYVSNDFNWLIELLPLDKNQIKLIEKQKKIKDEGLLPLSKGKFLGKDIETKEYDLLLEKAKSSGYGEEMIFLSNLITNYPNKNLGVGEEEVSNILDALIEYHQERFDIDSLHVLTELMSRRYWPDDLRKKIYSANNIRANTLNIIVSDLEDTSFDWARNNPLLISQLQIDFHKKAQNNDLRHYFYNVLDGKQKSDNLDDLIKSYGQSDAYFDFEEVRSLFLDNRIDKKYIQYFIQNVSNSDLLVGLNNGLVSQTERTWFLKSAIKYGQVGSATKILRELMLSGAIDSSEKRQEILNSLSENLLSKTENYNSSRTSYGNQNEVVSVADQLFKYDDDLTDILSKEERSDLCKKTLNSALDFSNLENATLLTLSHPKSIADVFPEDAERREYLLKLYEKLISGNNNRYYSSIFSSYFLNQELFEVLSDKDRLGLENKIFDLNINERSDDFLKYLSYMNDSQKENFINSFEKNYQVSLINAYAFSSFCRNLIYQDDFFEHKKVYSRIFLKLLNDPNLRSDDASTLFNEKIIFSDIGLRDAFFNNINRWPGINGTNILVSLASQKNNPDSFSLNTEEVKKISTSVMENRGLSPKFWKGYLQSDKDDPSFYLDESIFRAGIINISNDCINEGHEEIITFIKSLFESEFKFEVKDAQEIIKRSFIKIPSIERLEVFYNYDPALMEDLFKEGSYLDNYLAANISYSNEFNHKLLNTLIPDNYYFQNVNNFLKHLKKNNNLEMVAEFKKSISKLNKDQVMLGRKALLSNDFLDVNESKAFYKEITSSSKDNARTQIINSIDVIGSMLSNRNNLEKLGQFLDKPRDKDVANLKNIFEFIEKYSKENKGRSIAVMLFAREYLPGRPLEEVIEKVSYNLRKYGEVIENNSYKNIPAGLRASIGMEYEITSSTAKGYEELTSQPSLKKDIAEISRSARIGSGNDAVHEIATKPTDNPYLMLLEMKLLHDIEYIDLNFNRSENYQKGARGFHLTIGGEKGLEVNPETNFLQNAILAASWGGVQSGETGHKVNGGRGVSLRGRGADAHNNVAFFDKKTASVELRSLSIDKQETLQRAVTTAFNGAIAIQAFKECFSGGSFEALNLSETEDGKKNIEEKLGNQDKKIAALARLWINLISQVSASIKIHNESFIDNETYGYLDNEGVWVDAADFGGEYNKKRFESIIANIDPTLSLEEYAKTTEINRDDMFNSFSVNLSDKLIKINNLYLKPGTTALDNKENKTSVFKGDHANSISMLKVTKLDNESLEYYADEFLDKTVFDTAGEKRTGYYTLQGGSELMLTHAVQKSLTEFNLKMEKLLN